MKTNQSTSFEDYLKAYYVFKKPEEQEKYEIDFKKVQAAFIAEHGEIINQYLCDGYHTAALLSSLDSTNKCRCIYWLNLSFI